MEKEMDENRSCGCGNGFLGNLFGGDNQIILIIIIFLLFTNSGNDKCC